MERCVGSVVSQNRRRVGFDTERPMRGPSMQSWRDASVLSSPNIRELSISIQSGRCAGRQCRVGEMRRLFRLPIYEDCRFRYRAVGALAVNAELERCVGSVVSQDRRMVDFDTELSMRGPSMQSWKDASVLPSPNIGGLSISIQSGRRAGRQCRVGEMRRFCRRPI